MRHPGEIMMLATIVIGGIAVLGYFLGIYNSLVALKNLIARSFCGNTHRLHDSKPCCDMRSLALSQSRRPAPLDQGLQLELQGVPRAVLRIASLAHSRLSVC